MSSDSTNFQINSDLRALIECLDTGVVKGVNHPDILSELNAWYEKFSENPATVHLAKVIHGYLQKEPEERIEKFDSLKQQFRCMHLTNCSSLDVEEKNLDAEPRQRQSDFISDRRSLGTHLNSGELNKAQSIFNNDVVNRFELLEDCYHEGHFSDFRLVDDLIKGLNAENNKIGDFVSQNIIPSYGSNFQSALDESITTEGKLSDFRSFQALYYVNPQKAVRKGLEIINSVPVEFKAEIVFYLSREASCRAFTIGLLDSAETPVRQAAIRGLSYARWAGKKEFFSHLFSNTSHWQGLQWFFEKLSDSEIHSIIWEEIEIEIASLDLEGRVFDDSTDYQTIADLILCLHAGFAKEYHVNTFAELTKKLQSKIENGDIELGASNENYSRLISAIVHLLTKSEEPTAKHFLSNLEIDIPGEAFLNYFVSCAEVMESREFYQKFNHLFAAQLSKTNKIKRGVLIKLFEDSVDQQIDNVSHCPLLNVIEWDERWQEIGEGLIDSGSPGLAALIIKPDSTALASRLAFEIQERSSDDSQFQKAFLGLLKYDKFQFSGLFLESFIEARRKLNKSKSPVDRTVHRAFLNLIRLIPWIENGAKSQIKLLARELQEPYNLLLAQELEK